MFIRVSLAPTASRRASEVHSLFLLFSWRVLRRSRFPHPRPWDARSGLAAEAVVTAARIARSSAPGADCHIGPLCLRTIYRKLNVVRFYLVSQSLWMTIAEVRLQIYRNSDALVTVNGLCTSVLMIHVNVNGLRSVAGRCISRKRSRWAIVQPSAAAATLAARVGVWSDGREPSALVSHNTIIINTTRAVRWRRGIASVTSTTARYIFTSHFSTHLHIGLHHPELMFHAFMSVTDVALE